MKEMRHYIKTCEQADEKDKPHPTAASVIKRMRKVDPIRSRTGRQVENGQMFTITADSRDEMPDFDILLLQWDLLRMWRLAGGADPAIYPLNDYYHDDDDTKVPVGEDPQATDKWF
ncbi:hypothetical protein LZ32DRAFT_688093 [Colletotrichum eremochloae]|nr:hypothetical protein LZ32DRAFT_688093 [Colletotrichum eremochloae]